MPKENSLLTERRPIDAVASSWVIGIPAEPEVSPEGGRVDYIIVLTPNGPVFRQGTAAERTNCTGETPT